MPAIDQAQEMAPLQAALLRGMSLHQEHRALFKELSSVSDNVNARMHRDCEHRRQQIAALHQLNEALPAVDSPGPIPEGPVGTSMTVTERVGYGAYP